MQVTGQLSIQFEGNVIQTYSLTPTGVVTIGRAPEATITLPHPLISRAHVELRMQEQGVVVTDLGSSNGSFIGDVRLTPHQPRILAEGASLRVGPYQIRYQASGAAVSSQLPVSLAGERDELKEPGVEQEAKASNTHDAAIEPVYTINAAKGVPQVPQAVQPQPRALSSITNSIYQHYLPDVYQGNDFLQRFLSIFEDIWEPLEHRQDHIAMYFDPRTCPVIFLPWLASWLGLPLNVHWPEARKRRLLARAMDFYRWRGTGYGLIRIIEICTGLTAVITENPLEPFLFRIRITLPPEMAEQEVDKALLEELIQAHKPAHVGYILEVTA